MSAKNTNLTLTPTQEQAKTRLLQFLADPTQNQLILTGFAGTGKSTLLKQVCQEFQNYQKMLKGLDSEYKKLNWVFTATTNKAKCALQEILEENVTTIHSYFGIIPNKKYYPEVYLRDVILVIDECSYIDYGLLACLKKVVKNMNNAKILYIGDKTQLTPVGINHSPIFIQGIEEINLTEIVRQQSSPDLAELCTQLRSSILDYQPLPELKPSKHLIHVSKTEFEDLIKTDLKTSNNNKILAVSNKLVNKYNKMLYKHFTGNKTYKVGDALVNNHYVDGIKTDEEVYIRVIRKYDYILQSDEVVKGHVVGIVGKQNYYFLPNDHRKHKYAEDHIIHWIDLRPAYCSTIHKAQGSTYNNVYIDLSDLKKSKMTTEEKARLLYVAISRAKYKVYITGLE